MILDAMTLPRWLSATYLSYIAAIFLFATNPAQATELTGKLPGKFEVTNSGEATYTVPFEVPMATGGIRPELSLQYRHRAGTGIAGEKWTIEGLSRITRCRRTIAQDDEVLGVEFDYSDRFCLDGQRLVLVSGTYGVAGSKYRTEIESFRRIVAYGTQGRTRRIQMGRIQIRWRPVRSLSFFSKRRRQAQIGRCQWRSFD